MQNRRAAKREGKANGAGGSRGGESEAKALAEAESGAVRAKRGGPRRQGAERDTCEGTSINPRSPQNECAAGRVTKSVRWPEGQPHATRAVGAAFAAVAGSGGSAERIRLDTTGGTQTSGGGQALSGDVAGRGQAKDERGSSSLAHRVKHSGAGCAESRLVAHAAGLAFEMHFRGTLTN